MKYYCRVPVYWFVGHTGSQKLDCKLSRSVQQRSPPMEYLLLLNRPALYEVGSLCTFTWVPRTELGSQGLHNRPSGPECLFISMLSILWTPSFAFSHIPQKPKVCCTWQPLCARLVLSDPCKDPFLALFHQPYFVPLQQCLEFSFLIYSWMWLSDSVCLPHAKPSIRSLLPSMESIFREPSLNSKKGSTPILKQELR